MVDVSKLVGIESSSFHLQILKSIREFDRLEVEGVMAGLFSYTKREECFYALYLRAQRNVDTMLALDDVAHFQALATLSRTMFELCMDVELLDRAQDGDLRMRAYKSLELLRAAHAMVKHEDSLSNELWCCLEVNQSKKRYRCDKLWVYQPKQPVKSVAPGFLTTSPLA